MSVSCDAADGQRHGGLEQIVPALFCCRQAGKNLPVFDRPARGVQTQILSKKWAKMTFQNDGRDSRRWDDTYLIWCVLAVPAVLMVVKGAMIGGKFDYLYWTGILSCWLLLLALMITPLTQLVGPLPWLRSHRRYFGVASFAYACLHLAAWLVNGNLHAFLRTFVRVEVLPGWIALAILVPLAITSTDTWVRKLGPRWKSLQRWVYAAGILVLLHWVMTTDSKAETLVVGPLLVLSAYRALRYRTRVKKR